MASQGRRPIGRVRGKQADIAMTFLVIIAVCDVSAMIERVHKVAGKDLVMVTLDRDDFRKLIGLTL